MTAGMRSELSGVTKEVERVVACVFELIHELNGAGEFKEENVIELCNIPSVAGWYGVHNTDNKSAKKTCLVGDVIGSHARGKGREGKTRKVPAEQGCRRSYTSGEILTNS